jgi:hypothetical protein
LAFPAENGLITCTALVGQSSDRAVVVAVTRVTAAIALHEIRNSII